MDNPSDTPHKIPGTGYNLVPPQWEPGLCDGFLGVKDEEDVETTRSLARRPGGLPSRAGTRRRPAADHAAGPAVSPGQPTSCPRTAPLGYCFVTIATKYPMGLRSSAFPNVWLARAQPL